MRATGHSCRHWYDLVTCHDPGGPAGPGGKACPGSYLEIASGALIGIVVFDEFLDWLTLGGILIIVAVCLTNTLLNEMDADKQS